MLASEPLRRCMVSMQEPLCSSGATCRPGIGAEGDGVPSCRPTTGQEEDHMRYEAPNSLDQAVALLAHEPGEARVLAGGTDLLVQMRTDLIDPILVVDIKGIAELRQITEEAGGFRVGAAVTGAELKEHQKLKSVWPGIVEAANLIGSSQIQGRATMGGNLGY